MNDNVKNAGQPTMTDGPPVENISGSVRTVGSTARHNERGAGGRFKPREARIVGPLGPPGGVGPGGVDAVSGRFVAGVRNASQLHAVTTSPYYEVPDWGGHPPISTLLDDGSYPRHLRREV